MPEQSHQMPVPSRIGDRATWLISRAYGRSRGLLNAGFAASGAGLRSYHYRLLAALGYQESKLGKDARSQLGAFGILLVLPATGK